MSTPTNPGTGTPSPAAPTTNRLGLTKADYKGAPSTLCVGCGHDSITNHIITSFYELGINPHEVAKMSGIATVDGLVVAEAEVMCKLADKEEKPASEIQSAQEAKPSAELTV